MRSPLPTGAIGRCLTVLAALFGLALAAACSAEETGDGRGNTPAGPNGTPTPGTPGGGGPIAGNNFGNALAGQPAPPPMTINMGAPGACVNLQCAQHTVCAGGATTTLSGTVYDPAGNNPLYNVAVYVPNEALLPLPSGASCDSCDSLYSGMPVAAALTDAAGRFVMPNAPVGDNIPLVIQVGKWRRQFTLPVVNGCQDNPVPDGMLTLPKNRSEGDIPKIAISTGMADTLECLLLRIGVDPAEVVPGPAGDGRIHIFQGTPLGDPAVAMAIAMLLGLPAFSASPNTNPPGASSAAALWNTTESLMAYDIVLLSCEGEETRTMNQQALLEYANAGGRVFASHFHYSWLNTGPFGGLNLANWTTGAQDIGNINGSIVTTLPDGQPFPKGQALADWLQNVGALQNGLLPIDMARHNADVTPMHTPSQPWILAADGMASGATQYFSFNTPTMLPPDAMYCGRVVYSDLHVGAASGDNPTMPVPSSCTAGTLSPQEAALEFMLFDLSSCLTPDEVPPQPPLVK